MLIKKALEETKQGLWFQTVKCEEKVSFSN